MRYAIYYTPGPDDPMTRAAAKWLGRNPYDSAAVPIDHEFEDIVAAPRKYGFHGTLKAPFRLADGVREQDLIDQFQQFQSQFEPFEIPALKLDRLGPFFALVPRLNCKPLDQLAAKAVEAFEPFRAQLTEAEIAKRKPEQLSAGQRSHLKRWGYPYVFDEFRFHLTLTGPVLQEHAALVRDAIEQHFAAHLDRPHFVEGCALFIEPEPGAPFMIYTNKRAAA